MTNWNVVGIIVTLISFIGVFVARNNSSNKRWEKVNSNITENTLTLRKLQDYLNRLENEFDGKLLLLIMGIGRNTKENFRLRAQTAAVSEGLVDFLYSHQVPLNFIPGFTVSLDHGYSVRLAF